MTVVEKLNLVREGEYSEDQFLKENEGLVHEVIWNRFGGKASQKGDYEILFNHGLFGLYNAMLWYDEEKGYEFSTLAYRCIYNAVSAAYYKEIKKPKREPILSQEHFAIVQDKQATYEALDRLKTRYRLDDLDLTEKQKEYMQVYLSTLNYNEAARLLNTSRQSIHQKVVAVQRKFRDKYLSE